MKPSLQASAFLRYNDRRITFYPEWDAEGNTMDQQSIQQCFWMMDDAMQWPIWQERIKLTIGARNILNVQSVQQNRGNGGAHSGSGNTFPVSPGRSFFCTNEFHLFPLVLFSNNKLIQHLFQNESTQSQISCSKQEEMEKRI